MHTPIDLSVKRRTGSSGLLEAVLGLSTESIADYVSLELRSMKALLGARADTGVISALDRWMRFTLGNIGQLVRKGRIHPLTSAWRGRDLRSIAHAARPSRLGVFPISANPIHWMHIMAGLAAMESFRLDKVVYVVAGADKRKPRLAPEGLRHRTARDVLALFTPLLEYSPLALGSETDGEENFFRIIASHGNGALHAFYIAGGDHYRRFASPHGRPETIQKIENGIRSRAHGFDPIRHQVSAIFVPRDASAASIPTFLDVHRIPALPLQTSSTWIRRALVGEAPLSELSYLPITVFRTICSSGRDSSTDLWDPGVPARLPEGA